MEQVDALAISHSASLISSFRHSGYKHVNKITYCSYQQFQSISTSIFCNSIITKIYLLMQKILSFEVRMNKTRKYWVLKYDHNSMWSTLILDMSDTTLCISIELSGILSMNSDKSCTFFVAESTLGKPLFMAGIVLATLLLNYDVQC